MTTPPTTPPTPAPEPETTELPPLWSGNACPNGCPLGDCYCPDGSEPRHCGHGPGGTCDAGHCIDCDACTCGPGDGL